MSAAPKGPDDLLILLPLYNDWDAAGLLLDQIDRCLASQGLNARVLVIDDGSTAIPPEAFAQGPFLVLKPIEVLELKRNLGHQRAIAIGLAHVEERIPCGAVVLMDSDGEDDPADIPRLLQRCAEGGWREIVFAERARRSESAAFVLFYHLYKALHVLLTGIRVRVGNFSVIPRTRLESLAVVSELWNHYAAAVFKSQQPHAMIPTRRARRLSGRSRMNFVRLVVHGLSALSVFGDLIGVRLLVAAMGLTLLTVIGLVVIVVIRLATTLAIPGWATVAAGILLIILLQVLMFSVLFSFITLGGRQATSFIPRRDYTFFTGPVRRVHPRS